MEWEKGHGRLERRRLKRVSGTPEEIGLCGCWPREITGFSTNCERGLSISRGWQVLAVRREVMELGPKAAAPGDVIAYYVTSAVAAQYPEAELLAAIRGHWDAIEAGTHYRRDVSFGEDACGVSQRGAAEVLATLRNLALGLLDLAAARAEFRAPSAKSACRQMTFSRALAWLRR